MKLERIFLSILSVLPLKAVAYAADSRLTTIAGEEANSAKDWRSFLKKKSMIFGPMQMATTTEKAFERFLMRSGLSDSPEAQARFNELLELMLRDGMITTNEKMFISKGPSQDFGH